ncbi:MAG TPA: hypothetical protein VMH82_01605 [Myxococcota bacterium]|nr:hypothetical protein [Myxococcota bacterium]
MRSDAPRSSDAPSALVLALAACAVLALYALTARAVLDQDPFVMAEVARMVLRGQRLYGEVWDNKAPLTILFYAIPEWLAPRSYLAIQLFAGLCAIVQAWTALAYTRGHAWWPRAAAASLVLLGPLSRFEYAWASSEDAANLFAVVALFASLRIYLDPVRSRLDALAAGAAVVLAFHARQSSLLFGAIPVAALALGPLDLGKRVRGLAALAAGGVLAWLAVLGVVWAIGSVPGYIDTVFLGPRKYSGTPSQWVALFGFARNDALMLVLPASLIALVGRPRDLALSAVIAATGVASIAAPMRAHLHYWEQILPVASAMVFLALREQGERAARIGAASLIAFLGLNAGWTAVKCVLRPTTRDYYAVAEDLRALARPEATLFVVGRDSGPVYFAASRPHANEFFWDYYLFGVPKLLPTPLPRVLEQYEQRPPDLLVVDEDVLGEIRSRPAGELNAAWELVRRLVASGRYDEAGRHPGLEAGSPTTSWRYYRLRAQGAAPSAAPGASG